MKQISLATTGFELVTKRTRKREFLDEMNLVVPWSQLLALIAPHAPAGKTGRPPFATEVMLRIHLLQQFFEKGNQWHFGMKAHIGVDADSGLVHTVTTTPANAHDVTQAHALLHGQEEVVFADSGYRGVEKRQEIQDKHAGVDWEIAMMPGKRKALDKTKASQALTDRIEKIKASIRAKVEHPFRVIKCQFGHRKTRYRGLAKNTSQLLVMFALSNLWMVRKRMTQGLAA